MAQTMISFRMDSDLKKSLKSVCKEISTDPFYSESNMNYLRQLIADVDSGKTKFVEHDLIED